MSDLGQKYSGGGFSASREKTRQSNLELLRIVSMFLVLLIHYIPTRTTPSFETLHTDTLGTLFNMELRSIAKVCVNCFILISGYFGIKWRGRSICSLLFQVLFWVVAGYLIGTLTGIYEQGSLVFIKKQLVFWSSRWFLPAYLALYLVAPLINAFVEQCDEKRLWRYILVFYTVSTLYGYCMVSQEFNEGMSMISLMGLYLIGRYIGRFEKRWMQFNKYVDLSIYFGLGFLLVAINTVTLLCGIASSPYGYLNPVVIVQSVYLFLFFKKLDVGSSRVVNFIAASSFAAYLFQTHICIDGFYLDTCHWINDNCSAAFMVALGFIVAVFAAAVMVDRVRIWLFNIFEKTVQSLSLRNGRA
ncbi:MAG: acyltransferase family protein [Alistipes sp.]|nr:acyltransferase family protein [Alistipes sp.]